MALPPQVDAALAAFRALTTMPLPAEARAQRLRTEVLLPLARAYSDALQGDHRWLQHRPDGGETLSGHARATFAAARACLVILGTGRAQFAPETLREVLRLGEAFCGLHRVVLDRQDQDKLGRLGLDRLQATLAMVGAESASDLEAASRARQRFADLGDETASKACDHLIHRLGGTLDPSHDPLRTVEMERVDFVIPEVAGGGDTALMAVAPEFGEPAPLAEEPPVLAGVPQGAPSPVPPPLRPVARPNRGQESQRPTVMTRVWPPLRDERVHALSTAGVLVVLCVMGLLAFSAARRAAQAHRTQRATEGPTTAPSLRSVPAIRPATPSPSFSVVLGPPDAVPASAPPRVDAGAPRLGPGTSPASTPSGAPLDTEPLPGGPAEPVRARARRLNTEGFRAYEAGDRATALAQYRKATQADPTFSLPWYNLACVEALEGHIDASLEALETFHRIDPDVDLRRRVETDRDFERVRTQPAFQQGLETLTRPAAPQVPAEP